MEFGAKIIYMLPNTGNKCKKFLSWKNGFVLPVRNDSKWFKKNCIDEVERLKLD